MGCGSSLLEGQLPPLLRLAAAEFGQSALEPELEACAALEFFHPVKTWVTPRNYADLEGRPLRPVSRARPITVGVLQDAG